MNDIRSETQGRWESILSHYIDERYLTGKHGPCPICASRGEGGKDRFRFTDFQGNGNYICNPDGNGCGHGDGIDFLMKLTGWDFKTCAKEIRELLNINEFPVKKRRKKMPEKYLKRVAQGARRLQEGDAVSEYLKNRGLLYPPESLRIHPQLSYYDKVDDEFKVVGEFPAMLGLIVDRDNKPVSYHVTYIYNGKKADVPNPRKVLTPKGVLNGCAIRLYPIAKHIGVAEGIETAIAAFKLTKIPTWSLINTTVMKEFNCPEGIEKVTIFADKDEKFGGEAAAYHLAHKLSVKGIKCYVMTPQEGDWLDHFNRLSEEERLAEREAIQSE